MESRLIEVRIPKGTLYLTAAEFERGLRRGKAIVRHRQQEAREDRKGLEYMRNKERGVVG